MEERALTGLEIEEWGGKGKESLKGSSLWNESLMLPSGGNCRTTSSSLDGLRCGGGSWVEN